MNKIIRMLALLVLFSTGQAATAATTSTSACVPYTRPIQESIVACGKGMMGAKYMTETKVCPSGAISLSREYDTSECRNTPVGPGVINTLSKCIVTPDACAAPPQAANCPAGQHFTLAGTGIAHCVEDDPICAWGTSLTHDVNGNPSCIANTCPSNQVLQGDGIACACPASLSVWDGSSCSAPIVTCIASSVAGPSQSCPTGFNGTMTSTVITSCPSGSYGAPSTTTSPFDTSVCTPAAITCTAGTAPVGGIACGTGYTGTKYLTQTTSCPSGAYGAPVSAVSSTYNTADCGCANGGTDYPTCTAPPPTCTESVASATTACGPGYTGNQVTTTQYLCPSGSSTTTDTSACGCANGGSNYPTCTLPAVVTCTEGDYLDPNPRACPAPQTGAEFVLDKTTCPSGPYGAPSVASSVYYSTCAAPVIPPPTPTPTCFNGASDYPTCTPPTCSNGASDYPTCTPPCTPTSSSATSACGVGFNGNIVTTTNFLCPSGSNTSIDSSGCSCANGGSNFPTCTAPPPSCVESSSVTDSACGTGFSGTKRTTTTLLCPSGSKTEVDTSACGCANGALDYPYCTPPAAFAKCEPEEWNGVLTTEYGTKIGSILSGYIWVGCYGPTVQGTYGEQQAVVCGYVYNSENWPMPEDSSTGEFVPEISKTSYCTNGKWTH